MKNRMVNWMTKGYVVSIERMQRFARSERGDATQNWIVGGVITVACGLILYAFLKPQIQSWVQELVVDPLKSMK
ncbi:hypothetical protein [Paenibacillus bovis]|uniref:Uncharacterized protein n=1 Tax=Paenibacillus bovis TaxID=1616788 RepID=A0A1X9T444_9BACL|nr:hypothetical protein [Paenibacillus bovis]ARR10740.1 hypothetical protein AR543_p0132 [Paenibacillus bovis]